MANGISLDARNALLSDRVEGKGNQSALLSQVNQLDLAQLYERIVAVEHQRTINDATRTRLQARVTELEAAQEVLIAQNHENDGRMEAANTKLNNLKKDTKKLKDQQCCFAATLVLAGAGMVGGGGVLIAKEVIDVGIALAATGATTITTTSCSVAKTQS